VLAFAITSVTLDYAVAQPRILNGGRKAEGVEGDVGRVVPFPKE